MEASGGGMGGFISALTTGITTDTMWAEITKAAPFVIAMFIVAVGYRVLRRVINKGSKLKAGI
nr:MAG: coat protein [uncultured bacterium]